MNIVLCYIASRVFHWGEGAEGTGTSYIKIYTEVPLEYIYHSAKPVWSILNNWKRGIIFIKKKEGYLLDNFCF